MKRLSETVYEDSCGEDARYIVAVDIGVGVGVTKVILGSAGCRRGS